MASIISVLADISETCYLTLRDWFLILFLLGHVKYTIILVIYSGCVTEFI